MLESIQLFVTVGTDFANEVRVCDRAAIGAGRAPTAPWLNCEVILTIAFGHDIKAVNASAGFLALRTKGK